MHSFTRWLQIYGPDIYPRHCAIAHHPDGVVTVSPSQPEAVTLLNGPRISQTTVLHPGMVLQLGKGHFFRFCEPLPSQEVGYVIRRQAALRLHWA